MNETLLIQLAQGTLNLPPIDTRCIIKYGVQILKTRKEKNTSAPRYEITMPISLDENLDAITIECYHTGTLYNTLIGTLVIPVQNYSSALFEFASFHAYHLRNNKGVSIGTLELRLGLTELQSRKEIKTATTAIQKSVEDKSAEEVFKEAADIAEKNVLSTSRCLSILTQDLQLARETNEGLKIQGEQIERIRTSLANTTTDLDNADRKLRSIESPIGTVVNIITEPFVKKSEPASLPIKHEVKHKRSLSMTPQSRQSSIPFFADNSDRGEQETRLHRSCTTIDRNLDAMSPLLDDLKKEAKLMGKTINKQIKPLEVVINDAEKVDRKISNLSKRM